MTQTERHAQGTEQARRSSTTARHPFCDTFRCRVCGFEWNAQTESRNHDCQKVFRERELRRMRSVEIVYAWRQGKTA